MGEAAQFEDLLLKSARNGDHKTIMELLQAVQEGKANLNINSKGKSKCNLGWTPLHLSCYFGHKTCVETLLHNGAQVDVQNDSGDTPLHKSALTNREGIVMLLLEHGASVSVVNGEGLRPSDLARKSQVKKLILGAERAEQKSGEEKLLHATREGDTESVKKILQGFNAPNINCVDSMGNTSLHCASYRGHINVAVILLQNGCDPSIKNFAGKRALELVQSQQMEQVLAVPPIRTFSRSATRFEGPLLRRMRIVGWRMVWCVLERGVLTFFSSRADACSGVGRRDYKYLDNAKVVPAIGGDQAIFLIQYNDRTRHRLAALQDPVHSACVNRQKWVASLEDHIKFSTHYVQNGFSIDSDEDEEGKMVKPLGCMEDALVTAKAHQELLEQQLQELMALISYLEEEHLKQESAHTLIMKFSNLNTTARNMVTNLSHCLSLLKQQEEARELQLKEEKEKVRVLEESLQVLATEHHDLEESIASRLTSSSDRASLYNTPANSFMSLPRPRRFFPAGADEEFFDAFSQDEDTCTLKSVPSPCESECSTSTLASCMSSLPLDPPQSFESHQNEPLEGEEEEPRLPCISSVSTSICSSPDHNESITYNKLASKSQSTNVGVADIDTSILGESIFTISSGTYQKNSTNASTSLTITLSESNIAVSPINNCLGKKTSTSNNLQSNFPSSMSPLPNSNLTSVPSSTLSVTVSSNPSSPESTPLSNQSSHSLDPEIPLVRTSDLSEHENSVSGDSDTTISSQSKGEIQFNEDENSAFSLIHLDEAQPTGPSTRPQRIRRYLRRDLENI